MSPMICQWMAAGLMRFGCAGQLWGGHGLSAVDGSAVRGFERHGSMCWICGWYRHDGGVRPQLVNQHTNPIPLIEFADDQLAA
eukprot:scaffold93722_cov30-Prasinocladus_malaysianus.AAC.1